MPFERRLLAGLPARLPAGGTYRVRGRDLSSADLVALVAARVEAMELVGELFGRVAKARAAEEETEKTTRAPFAALVSLLYVMYGSEPDILVELGLAPRRTPDMLSLEERTARVEKARATRAARHTMGRKQRLAIHGEIEGPPEPPPLAK
jgi:hypothetical protein